MQTDAEPFLQRIRAFPDTDGPRLVFADWLEEQGGREAARAAFIRTQVALANLSDDDPRRPGLLVRERELFDAHRDTWEAPLRGLASGLVFRRGFVDEVKIAARQFLRHADALFAAGPIRHIHLLDVGGSLPAVMQSPYLGRLTVFTIWAQHAGEPLARAVAGSSHLSGLRTLHLGRNRIDDGGAEHLAGASVLANLEELDLSENELGEAGARALAASQHLGKLRVLDLRHNRVGPPGAEAIAGSDRLAALDRLVLTGNAIGVRQQQSPSRAWSLLRIPAVDLGSNGLTPAGLRMLLTPPQGDDGPVHLRELDLSKNELGEDGARVLAESPTLVGLRVLRLVGCNISDDAARVLAYSPHLNRLAALDLGNNPVGDRGFQAFLETPFLRGLRRFVPGAGVTPDLRRALNKRFHRGFGDFC